MSKFIFSSFIIGVGASTALCLAVNEELYNRRNLFRPPVDNDELTNEFYQQKLREKIIEKQLKLRKSQWEEMQRAINDQVVPVIVDASNKVFSKSPKELFDEVSKKFK
mmetsp:Transcript_27097/g.20273  ORF Transcript_27097/g.20273 Transcript_27097/m.20273 type:complete len:108 (+) Transcript_27097:146-469(+)